MSPLCLKRKTQHESQSIVTNTTTDLIHQIEADWEEVLDDLIKQNNIHLANKLDKKKLRIKRLHSIKCKQHHQKNQSSLKLSVNTMITTQIEAINQNMITTIHETMNNYTCMHQ